MHFFTAMKCATILHHLPSFVSSAGTGHKGLQQRQAHRQELRKNASLNLINPYFLVGVVEDRLFEGVKLLLGIEQQLFLRQDTHWVPRVFEFLAFDPNKLFCTRGPFARHKLARVQDTKLNKHHLVTLAAYQFPNKHVIH